MVAALRSEFGPLPDQSMHEKTAVPSLINEIYDFLRQADAIELNDLFKRLEKYKFVHSGGELFNNSGENTENKSLFIRNSKFNIACENESYPGYTTEKILEAFLAGCIPVYWGNPEIALEFNEKAYYGKVKGMWTHTNTRKDKFDIYPHPKLIEMLQSL